MKSLIFMGALALSASAVSAQTPASASSGTTVDPGQIICRSISGTGSRLSRTRVCMTRAQWDERRRETRETLEHVQSSRRTSGGG